MPDCFLSYSTKDKALALAVYSDLQASGLEVFMAAISLQPGDRWANRIHQALAHSRWVIFLASKSACRSQYVQQEIGGALQRKKEIIPVVWDMPPTSLPGWTNQLHAIDLRQQTPEQMRTRIVQLARSLKASKDKGLLIAAGLLTGFFILASRQEKRRPPTPD